MEHCHIHRHHRHMVAPVEIQEVGGSRCLLASRFERVLLGLTACESAQVNIFVEFGAGQGYFFSFIVVFAIVSFIRFV